MHGLGARKGADGGPQLEKSGGPELTKSGGTQLTKSGGSDQRKSCSIEELLPWRVTEHLEKPALRSAA
jgi:hypothetical protein